MTRVSSLQSDISSTILDQLVPNSSLAHKHLMLIKKNVQGFSLIELMVAVGIMGGMTTLAVPQYGKYKLKAAQTEVKATLANIHGAQELHLVDKNYYAVTLKGIGLADSIFPTVAQADGAGQNFVYSKEAVNIRVNAAKHTDNSGIFKVSNGGAPADGTTQTDSISYSIVASATRKLASCATLTNSKSEVWCLDNNKLITNTAISTLCPATQTNDSSGSC